METTMVQQLAIVMQFTDLSQKQKMKNSGWENGRGYNFDTGDNELEFEMSV